MTLTKEELSQVLQTLAGMPESELLRAEAVINSRKTLLKQVRVSNFRPGQHVRFPDEKGNEIDGYIKRVNRYTVLVDVDGQTRRCQVDHMKKLRTPRPARQQKRQTPAAA